MADGFVELFLSGFVEPAFHSVRSLLGGFVYAVSLRKRGGAVPVEAIVERRRREGEVFEKMRGWVCLKTFVKQ